MRIYWHIRIDCFLWYNVDLGTKKWKREWKGKRNLNMMR